MITLIIRLFICNLFANRWGFLTLDFRDVI